MQFTFDGFNRYEIPELTLCNPNFTELNIVQPLHLPKMNIRFNAISEMVFEISELDENGVEVEYYSSLAKNRIIHMDGFGYWVIGDVVRELQGTTEIKTVTCFSYQYMLSMRNADLKAGTYRFYDPANPDSDSTLMGVIIKRLPSWKIGKISTSLCNKYRTFEMVDDSIFNFLTNDAAEAYEAVFDFDTENLEINAYDTQDAVKHTDIVFTWDNLMKSVQIAETDDPVITALSVYGSGDFSISEVNPLGTPTIYRFDYFAEQMTPALWEKVSAWQQEIINAIESEDEGSYKTILTDKKAANAELLALRANSLYCESFLDAAKQVQDVSGNFRYCHQGDLFLDKQHNCTYIV